MNRTVRRVLALLLALPLCATASHAAETEYFWDLPPEHLRLLVASPQVMVTRKDGGWEAYCRCPVVLRPSEIPDVVKKAIVADRKSTRLNSSHGYISYAVFCLKKKKKKT